MQQAGPRTLQEFGQRGMRIVAVAQVESVHAHSASQRDEIDAGAEIGREHAAFVE